MLHAGMLAACADCPVKRIIVGHGAECRDIARTKATDRLRIERRFARRQQHDALFGAGRKLRFGIEAADGLQLGTEEIQPQGLLAARRPQIDDAAAQRKLARLADGAGVAVGIAG